VSGFGHPMLRRWDLEPGSCFLNHGSFGATPRVVLEAQQHAQRLMERQPVRFFMDEQRELVRGVAERLGAYVGSRPGGLVLVDNASSGVSTVLSSVDLRPGDRVVALSHLYGAVDLALQHYCGRRGARVQLVELPCPLRDEAWLEDLDRALVGARLAVLDHITSASALVLPIERMVQICRDRGVPVLVDGAHGPGQVPLDLEQLGATWYTGNAHKWLCAPKGCALLWASEEGLEGLHPSVISHGYGQRIQDEFDFVGTRDYSPWLALPAALDFRDELGDQAVTSWNHDLARWGRGRLIEALGTEGAGGDEHVGSMATVRLPGIEGDAEAGFGLSRRLWAEHRIEVPFVPLEGALWVRISGQVYNERRDVERLVEALGKLT
jgi:isopenicillin-N epimerase